MTLNPVMNQEYFSTNQLLLAVLSVEVLSFPDFNQLYTTLIVNTYLSPWLKHLYTMYRKLGEKNPTVFRCFMKKNPIHIDIGILMVVSVQPKMSFIGNIIQHFFLISSGYFTKQERLSYSKLYKHESCDLFQPLVPTEINMYLI